MATSFDVEEFLSGPDLSYHHLEQLKKVDLKVVAAHVGALTTASMRKAEICRTVGIHMGLIVEAPCGGFSKQEQIELAKARTAKRAGVEEVRIRT